MVPNNPEPTRSNEREREAPEKPASTNEPAERSTSLRWTVEACGVRASGTVGSRGSVALRAFALALEGTAAAGRRSEGRRSERSLT
jgi:hypothetical protein